MKTLLTPLESAAHKLEKAEKTRAHYVSLTRAEWSAMWLKENSEAYDAPLLCRCPQRDYPHELSVHSEIRSEWWAHKRNLSWPWSLMMSGREEPSTERNA